MVSSISFDPYVSQIILAGVGGLLVLLLFVAGWLGLKGWFLRGCATLLLLLGLANPSYREEDRNPLQDIVFLIVDETSSQLLGDRQAQMDETLPDLLAELGQDPDDPIDVITVSVKDAPDNAAERGTLLLSELAKAAAEVSPDRIAGAIIVSDGRIHDLQPIDSFPAPVHLVQTGHPEDWDRRIIMENGPAFGIVGETVEFTIKVEDSGPVPAFVGDAAVVEASVDGGETQRFTVRPGESIELELTLEHAGINLLQFATPEMDGELTPRNNATILQVNGVRDRLRVLLVSGEPYAGERTWRNLLKADASVDLVHFTILRSPEKQDGVPVNELSLIAFPTRELFMDKIDDFDLIIFDRYRRRGVLPDLYLENIARYVRDGGAVLVASGPAFAEVESLARTPFRAVLPAMPTGRVFEEGYKPTVSDIGRRHPVTAELESFFATQPSEDGTPGWGRWFRQIDLQANSGNTVMTGVDGRPLLVLDRVEEGRIAVLGSDHAWLWSRGYEGGGPQLELLRRLAHWLMQEPELEEEVLVATSNGRDVTVERRSLGDISSGIEFTSPSGDTATAEFTELSPGRWTTNFIADEDGVYHVSDGALQSVVAVGPAAPKEFEQPIGVSDDLVTLISGTGGGIFQIAEIGSPDIRRTRFGRVAKGTSWLGLPERDAYTVEDIRLTPLAPGWLILILAAIMSVMAWRIEGR